MAKTAMVKSESKKLTRSLGAAISEVILAWADSSTDPTSRRRQDLLRDKSRTVLAFFDFAGTPPDQVTPADVRAWQLDLEGRGLAPATVYASLSRVSSFYNWARKDPALADRIPRNPVDLARPKAPKAFQSESTKALDDEQITKLIQTVKSRADAGDIVGLRDYALLLHFLLTGRRRQEVMSLRWGDVKINGVMVITYRVKGSDLETRVVRDPVIRESMLAYLEASGRLETLESDDPIWTRHDRAGDSGRQLTSHAFVKNLKRYALDAGIGEIHLHQLRHTFARMAGDEGGSLGAVQEALGHKNQATTRVYLQRVGVRGDRFSAALAERLGIG